MAESPIKLNDKKIRKFLDGLVGNVDKIDEKDKAYAGGLSTFVFRDVLKHFEEERGPKGPWDEWSIAYASHMIAIGKHANRMLQFSGHLRQSFKPTNWRKDERGLVWFNPAKTSSGFPYAAHHDAGRSSGEGNPRAFMWLSGKAMKDINKFTARFVLGGK